MELTFHISDRIDLVAIYAAIVSTCVLTWNIVTWTLTGPRLRGAARLGMKMLGDADDDDDRWYVVVNVANIGTAPTTITHVFVYGYANWFQYLSGRQTKSAFVKIGPPSHPIPYVLKNGETFMALINQDKELEEWSRTTRLYVAIAHSSTRRNLFMRLPPITRPTPDEIKKAQAG